jgi:hypothetical protein
MDGRTALYIKNSKDVSDLQMNMIVSGSTLTFSIKIGGQEVYLEDGRIMDIINIQNY